MNFIKRIIVSLVFIPLLLLIYYTGSIYLKAFLALLTVISSHELFKMFSQKEPGLLYVNVVLALYAFIAISTDLNQIPVILLLMLIINGIRDVFWNKIEGATQRFSYSMFLIFYPALGFGMLFRLTDFHPTLVPILAILIWVTDIFAYLGGMLFGKHKGILKCSPNKSLEGFISGFIFALICSFFIQKIFPDIYSLKHIIILSISAGIFGQFGDLIESIIKRDMGVKDSSNIIPGHGGILDRFDSLLIAAPVMCCLMTFI